MCYLSGYLYGGIMMHPPLIVSQSELVFCAKAAKDIAIVSSAGVGLRVGCVIWDAPKRTIVAVGCNEEGRHAEDIAVSKLTKTQKWFGNLVMVITHPPCFACADVIASVRGIEVVYYLDFFKNLDGVEHLAARKKFVHRLVSPTYSTT
jgi:tRNA(Arg) A34 adenosine deaminase TadA